MKGLGEERSPYGQIKGDCSGQPTWPLMRNYDQWEWWQYSSDVVPHNLLQVWRDSIDVQSWISLQSRDLLNAILVLISSSLASIPILLQIVQTNQRFQLGVHAV